MIPYGRQVINAEDVEAVVATLNSDFLTQGPAVSAFEKALADYCGAKYAVAVNSATSALHIACLALDVGPGDLVWTCAISFAASANCARYCGAEVDFVDIDPDTLNICPLALANKLQKAKSTGRLPKVVIPIDFCGRSAPMSAIKKLAIEYGFKTIEDASHAIGGSYQDKKIGGHGLADITVFSFHPVKIITSAEGGMAVTADVKLAERLADLRTHGITRDATRFEHKGEGAWYYEQQELGYNYRMTDLHAALGLSQLKRIDSFIEARKAVRTFYEIALKTFEDTRQIKLPPKDDAGCQSALHLYPIEVLPASGKTRREVFDSLRQQGIGVNVHYLPIYRHPYYQQLGFKTGYCESAEIYYSRAISMPMYAALDEEKLHLVVDALGRALGPAAH
jgi:UDP-4-amino-4,6-dideoxy-N-acetyl-beta-L-altrosamine transaminase